jgi:hypothetical protein
VAFESNISVFFFSKIKLFVHNSVSLPYVLFISEFGCFFRENSFNKEKIWQRYYKKHEDFRGLFKK